MSRMTRTTLTSTILLDIFNLASEDKGLKNSLFNEKAVLLKTFSKMFENQGLVLS